MTNKPTPLTDITLAQLLINVFSVLFIVCTFLYLQNEQFQQEQRDAQELDAARQRQIAIAHDAARRNTAQLRARRLLDAPNPVGYPVAAVPNRRR